MTRAVRIAAFALAATAGLALLALAFAGYLRPEALVDFANRMFFC